MAHLLLALFFLWIGYLLWKVLRLLLWVLVKAALVVCVAAGASLLVGALAASAVGQEDGLAAAASGLGAGLVSGLIVLVALWRRAFPTWTQESAPIHDQTSSEPSDLPPPEADETDPEISAAWKSAERLLPEARRRLAAARSDCARVLVASREDAAPDMALIDCAVLIRRQVPALVEATAALWEHSTPVERKVQGQRLLESLERLAATARAETDRHRRDLEDALDAVHAHVANRTRTE